VDPLQRILHALLVTTVAAIGTSAAADNTPRASLNAATFDAVWTTVRDTHWDPTLGGVDWPAVRVELLPRAEAAADDAALRVILMDALGRLKQSHFTIIPGELSAATEDEPANTPTAAGTASDTAATATSPDAPRAGATDAPNATPAPRPTRVAREGHCGATISFMARAGAADRCPLAAALTRRLCRPARLVRAGRQLHVRRAGGGRG
jgi:hypothetical protein